MLPACPRLEKFGNAPESLIESPQCSHLTNSYGGFDWCNPPSLKYQPRSLIILAPDPPRHLSTMASYANDPVHPEGAATPDSGSQIHTYGSPERAGSNDNEDDPKKKKNGKRRKVNHACLYCRRSHMTCDEGRPCQRWCAVLVVPRCGLHSDSPESGTLIVNAEMCL